MGFWPFGKKDKDEPDDVDFASRVVTASPRDGTRVRGKVTIHLTEPGSHAVADEVMTKCAGLTEEVLRDADSHEDLLGEEAHVAAKVLARLGGADTRVRSLEVVALHVVGDAPSVSPRPSSRAPEAPSATPRPPSAAPRPASVAPRAPSSPALADEPASRRVSSAPPVRRPGSIPPAGGAAAPLSVRRPSSGQMLAVRADRLVPARANPEVIGRALGPLMRDEATKLLIAVLRSYDLLVIKRISIDDAPDLIEALSPASTAPLGHFAESRAEELARWENALGLLKLDALRAETATIACALLHKSLEHSQVPTATATTILEKTATTAFEEEVSPLGGIGRYLHLVDVSPTTELCDALVKVLGHDEELRRLDVALGPVLVSIQEDLSLAAAQSRDSLGTRV